MQSTDFIMYVGCAILGLVIYGLVIRWAVRADHTIRQQKAMIALLIKLCRKNGVSDDDIDGIKNTFGLQS
mgnify:CR=1 FL=1|jgi:hypothetical protein